MSQKLREANFQDLPLRGRDFSHTDLAGANFRGADIRGTKFTGSNLKGANFEGAKAGLTPYWICLLLLICLPLFILTGVILGLGSLLAASMFQPYFTAFDDYKAISGQILLVALGTLIVFTIRRGFFTGLVSMTIVMASLSAVVGTLAGILPGVGAGALVLSLVVTGTLLGSITGGLFLVVTQVDLRFLAAFESLILTVAVGGMTRLLSIMDEIVTRTPREITNVLTPCEVSALVQQLTTQVGACNVANLLVAAGHDQESTLILAVPVIASLLFLIGYTSWKSLAGDPQFDSVRRMIIAFGSLGGTSFRDSDLSEAKFKQASLGNSDLRAKQIFRTDWFQAKGLDKARVGNSYLKNLKIRQLLVTRNGSHQKLQNLQLRGINLAGVNLEKADLTGTDLSQATLVCAHLADAILVQTQLDGTDLTEAHLTGACLENWGITTETLLTDVHCDYIYTVYPDRCRKPDNLEEVFEEGDFADFICPLVGTLNLYHGADSNLRAIPIALKRLITHHPDAELEIAAIEKRDTNFVIRLKTAPDVDRAKLHHAYLADYNSLQNLPDEILIEILKAQERTIEILKDLLSQALNQPVQSFALHESSTGGKKKATLTFAGGSVEEGFPVILLQIGQEGKSVSSQYEARLPSAPDLKSAYEKWQGNYQKLGQLFRLKKKLTQVTNIAISPVQPRTESWKILVKDCQDAAQTVKQHLNNWLDSDPFHAIRQALSEEFSPTDEIRLIIQTDEPQLRRLPWHTWDWFEQFPQAEVALGTLTSRQVSQSSPPKAQLRILILLGDSTGINTAKDHQILHHLPNAEIVSLTNSNTRELTNHLQDPKGWDILCFAGHSESDPSGDQGWLYLNEQESLSIEEIKLTLTEAINRGLKMAVFNSCDGLGLARQISALNIPQLIVMREAVPDVVAQAFLQHFVEAFAAGQSLYTSVRTARENLRSFEGDYPCASWMPVICQNPSLVSWSWQEMWELNLLKLEKGLDELQKAPLTEPNLDPRSITDGINQVEVLKKSLKYRTIEEMQVQGRKALWLLKALFFEKLPPDSPLVKEFSSLLLELDKLFPK